MLLNECARRGIETNRLLHEVGINAGALSNSVDHVPIKKTYELWSKAIAWTGDESFGLHVGRNVPFGAYRLVDYMAAASNTPYEALIRTANVFGLLNNTFFLCIRRWRQYVYIELHDAVSQEGPPRPYVEYIFATILRRFQFTTQTEWPAFEIHLRYRLRQDIGAYHQLFRTRIRSGQMVNRMVMPREVMDMPHSLADPELCLVLEEHATRKLHIYQGSKDTIVMLRLLVEEGIKRGTIHLEHISRRLGMSPRSLQRAVLSHGTSFREILDEARCDYAKRLLESKLSLDSIAARLDFSGPGPLCRAFHRWTGISPDAYRKQLKNLQVNGPAILHGPSY
jgi:AraC-like DNA-binding protein